MVWGMAEGPEGGCLQSSSTLHVQNLKLEHPPFCVLAIQRLAQKGGYPNLFGS